MRFRRNRNIKDKRCFVAWACNDDEKILLFDPYRCIIKGASNVITDYADRNDKSQIERFFAALIVTAYRFLFSYLESDV